MDKELDQVGPRLRAARKDRELTLDELATRAGMNASTLSRLESGKRQASLDLLLPLTRQLGIRIEDLLPGPAPDPRVRRNAIHRNGIVIAPLSPEGAPIHTYKITYPPTSTPPHMRTHDGYEWLYVLTGSLRLRLGDREMTLRRGEAAEFDTLTPHAMWAPGPRSAQIISIFNDDGVRMHTHEALT